MFPIEDIIHDNQLIAMLFDKAECANSVAVTRCCVIINSTRAKETSSTRLICSI